MPEWGASDRPRNPASGGSKPKNEASGEEISAKRGLAVNLERLQDSENPPPWWAYMV